MARFAVVLAVAQFLWANSLAEGAKSQTIEKQPNGMGVPLQAPMMPQQGPGMAAQAPLGVPPQALLGVPQQAAGMPPQGIAQPPMGQMPQQPPAGMPPQGMPQQPPAGQPRTAPTGSDANLNSQFPVFGGYPGFGYSGFGYPGFGYPSYGYGYGYPGFGYPSYGYGYPGFGFPGYGYGFGYPFMGYGYAASPLYGFGYETPAEPMFGAPPNVGNGTESSTNGQPNYKYPYGDYSYPYAYETGYPTYGSAAQAMHNALFGAQASASINLMQSPQTAVNSIRTQISLSDYSFAPQAWLPYTSYVEGR